jgi:hypothetical protein
MRKLGEGRNRFWQNRSLGSVCLEELFLPFQNDRRPKKGDSGHFYESVENKSLIICVQEGGREAPKFEIFCVITCGLTTHKISIAAPAEGLFIHYNKENYMEGR